MMLVTGVTGNVGSQVAEALIARGIEVGAVVRDADRPIPEGTRLIVADLNEPASFDAALPGAQAIFVLAGYDGLDDLLGRARAAGVEHVALLSSSSADGGNPQNAVARYHMESERAVRESGLGWTIVRPNAFMSNALRWVPQLQDGDVVRIPFADVRSALIHPADIGEVLAAGMAERNGSAVHRITGPQPLLPSEQLAVIADATGRPLRLEAQPDDEARAEMSSATPPEYVDAFFRFYRGGELDESIVTTGVSDVLGRAPQTLDEWVADNVDSFGRPDPASRDGRVGR